MSLLMVVHLGYVVLVEACLNAEMERKHDARYC